MARQAAKVPCWAKVAVESDPTKLECKDKRRLYSSSGIETTLDVGGSDCEGGFSTWKLALWAEGLPYNSQQKSNVWFNLIPCCLWWKSLGFDKSTLTHKILFIYKEVHDITVLPYYS